MHTLEASERLDLASRYTVRRSTCTCRFAAFAAARRRRRRANARPRLHQLAAVRHLVGRDADMVELLRHRQLDAPTVIDRSPPGLERVTSRAARLGLLRPVAPLDQLQLTRAQHHAARGRARSSPAGRRCAWRCGSWTAGVRRQLEVVDLGIRGLVQAQGLGDRCERPSARRLPDLAGQVGPARLERGPLLPEPAQPCQPPRSTRSVARRRRRPPPGTAAARTGGDAGP